MRSWTRGVFFLNDQIAWIQKFGVHGIIGLSSGGIKETVEGLTSERVGRLAHIAVEQIHIVILFVRHREADARNYSARGYVGSSLAARPHSILADQS